MTCIRAQLFLVIIYCVMLNNHCWKSLQNMMFVENHSGRTYDGVAYTKVL